jgi:hypothetical protein
VRTLATVSLAILALILTACGGSPAITPSGGPLSGNWQINLLQQYPKQTPLSASGFIAQANEAITGSIEVAPVGTKSSCGGVAPLTGTVSGQSVTFSLNDGGTVVNYTGTVSSNNQTMSGDYQAVGGACFTAGTSGTWGAVLVPPLNGSFTGTLSGSSYMSALTGQSNAAPIAVSGTFTQSSNAEGSNATLTGTITAVDYPCFTTASLTGTISGQNVFMDVFSYNGEQIGTLGIPGVPSEGAPPTPATLISSSTGLSLVGTGEAGLALGQGLAGPCPAIFVNGVSTTGDVTSVALTFKGPATN